MIEVNGKSLIKKSYRRLVISGKNIELYEYQKPYFYNFAPKRKRVFLPVDGTVKKERRRDNVFRLRQKVNRLILANVDAFGQKPKFVTFTFAENVKDLDVANKKWSLFLKKFNYFLNKLGMAKIKFLTVIEFQERGAVHYHVLFFNLPYIPEIKGILAKLWSHGFVKIVAVQRVKHLGLYVSKYMQKGFMDNRLRRRKAFFISRGLVKPRQYRNNQDIIDFLDINDTIQVSDTIHVPNERYGIIGYSQYKKIQ